MTGQIKKFVLAQKKIKSETVETYYKKLKKMQIKKQKNQVIFCKNKASALLQITSKQTK